jgi:hypothetical protein
MNGAWLTGERSNATHFTNVPQSNAIGTGMTINLAHARRVLWPL